MASSMCQPSPSASYPETTAPSSQASPSARRGFGVNALQTRQASPVLTPPGGAPSCPARCPTSSRLEKKWPAFWQSIAQRDGQPASTHTQVEAHGRRRGLIRSFPRRRGHNDKDLAWHRHIPYSEDRSDRDGLSWSLQERSRTPIFRDCSSSHARPGSSDESKVSSAVLRRRVQGVCPHARRQAHLRRHDCQ